MPFSDYLESKRQICKDLVAELNKSFDFVSILATDVKSTVVSVNKNDSGISDGSLLECGFVVKMYSGNAFYEHSFDDLSGDVKVLAQKIISSVQIDKSLIGSTISCKPIDDSPLKKSFLRESDFDNYTDKYLLDFCKDLKDKVIAKDSLVKNAFVILNRFTVSKLFISKNKELDQHYGWVNGFITTLYGNDEKTVEPREGAYSINLKDVLDELPTKVDTLIHKAQKFMTAKQIKPGVYDCITDPDMSGLIAHEAFGHGVEMDQFVKDRALAKNYVGKYVASPICNMKDGASSCLSTASYFFDDDGVLAHDTQIIKDGILVSGISDLTSATELGTTPTGNGRRESFKRKSYTRMTNTFFEKGKDKFEDMVKSIKHGYYLCEMNNGMEDPKNWQIQCTAEYGIEIIDGKLTDNYVTFVVLSGYVPDLLKSISMISDELEVVGSGSCGKGYKEWVRVSSGGPHLKVRVKLA